MPIQKLRPSYTLDQDRLDDLRDIVPEAFVDGKVNWDVLKESLGSHLEAEDDEVEYFGLFWPGKRDAHRLASLPSTGGLVPQPGSGINEDMTHHVFIEGENLEVMKLLQKSYAGRIKMIYIDPPYNTGNNFIYSDDFSEPLETYLRRTRQADEEGLLTTNTRAGGRFHSVWLSMMYPRLIVARHLLKKDGFIFVSIDDNEVHHLRVLMDEVFGEENFVGTVTWERKRKGSHLSEKFTQKTEYIAIYARQKDSDVRLFGQASGVDEDQPLIKRTNKKKTLEIPANVVETPMENQRFAPGVYGEGSSSIKLLEPTMIKNGVFSSPVVLEGPFVWTQEYLDEELTHGARFFIRTTNFSLRALKAPHRQGFKALSSFLSKDLGTNEDATTELAELLKVPEEELPIDYPKPSSLIKHLVRAATHWDRDSIILDFFAGSCTTAHAVFRQNLDDGGHRRFIMVQLPEKTELVEFPTIADVGRARIQRVISALQRRPEDGQIDPAEQDLGFKCYKLANSNFMEWKPYVGQDVEEIQMIFDAFETPLRDSWNQEDLRTEILLMEGFPLDSEFTPVASYQHNQVELATSDFHDHRLLVCLDETIFTETIAELDLADKSVFVCLDSALNDETKVQLSDTGNIHVI